MPKGIRQKKNFQTLDIVQTMGGEVWDKHFESSQKLRKDGIGIWENFIRNKLSNYMLCTSTGILYMLGLS